MSSLSLITGDTKIINLETYNEQDLVKYLKAIINAVEYYGQAQKDLIHKFSDFVEIRKINIDRMKRTADKLDKYNHESNKQTVLEPCLVILGGAIVVGGAIILAAATRGAAAPLIFAAVSAAGGAAATIGGMTILEERITRSMYEDNERNKTLSLLYNDRIHFERVFRWVERIAQLEQAVENIMNFSGFQGVMEAFNEDPATVHATERVDRMRQLPMAVQRFVDSLATPENQKRQLRALLLEILRSADAFALFKKILYVFKEMAPFISKAYKAVDGAIKVFRLADATLGVGNAVGNTVKNTRQAAQLAVVFGAVAAIDVVIDIWICIPGAKDMAMDRKSELFRRFRHYVQQMQNELNASEQIYFALTDTILHLHDLDLDD